MKCKATQLDTIPLCEAAASQNGRRAHQRALSYELLLEKAKFLLICHPGGGPCVTVCSRPGRRQSAARADVTQSLLTTFPMPLFVYVVSLLTGLF